MKKTYLLLVFLLISGTAYSAETFTKLNDGEVVASEVKTEVKTYNIERLIIQKKAIKDRIVSLQAERAEIVRVLQAAKAQGIVVNDQDIA